MLGREEVEEFWARCLLRAEAEIPRQSFETWLRPTRLLRLDNKIAVIEVPSSFFAEWLEQHYLLLIQSVISEQSDVSPQISFSVASTAPKRELPPTVLPEPQTRDQKKAPSDSTPSL
ncbi:MAG: hypothetical protein KAV99_07920, partial [Candidatus Latescibacteria bacterium]|nr:hypothetical protein [Candidatus Latescibacterota bacterium]